MESLNNCVREIWNDLVAVSSRVVVLENKSSATDSELENVTTELLGLKNVVQAQAQAISTCKEDMNAVMNQSLVDENQDKMCNLFFLGLNNVPSTEAASQVSDILVGGLSLSADDLPPFTMIQYSKKNCQN